MKEIKIINEIKNYKIFDIESYKKFSIIVFVYMNFSPGFELIKMNFHLLINILLKKIMLYY